MEYEYSLQLLTAMFISDHPCAGCRNWQYESGVYLCKRFRVNRLSDLRRLCDGQFKEQ